MALKNVCYTVDIGIPELSREIETFFWKECVQLEKESPPGESSHTLLLKYQSIDIAHVQRMLDIRRDISADTREIRSAIEYIVANASKHNIDPQT